MDLKLIGAKESDTLELAKNKRFATTIAFCLLLAGAGWFVLYFSLGYRQASMVPLFFCVLLSGSIIWFGYTRQYVPFIYQMAVWVLLAPPLFQLLMGGYEKSGAVALWSIFAPLGILIFLKRASSAFWLAADCGILIICAWLNPYVASHTISVPATLQQSAFAATLVLVQVMVYATIFTFVKRNEEYNKLLLAKSQELESYNLVLGKNLVASQQELLRNASMNAVTNVVANVAHEINSPIGAIRAQSQNLIDQFTAIQHSLPGFLLSLRKEELTFFHQLTLADVSWIANITTKEERKIRRSLETALVHYEGIDPPDMARDLMHCGYKSPIDLPKSNSLSGNFFGIVRNAARINLIRLGLDGIHASTDKTDKIVWALKILTGQINAQPVEPVDLQKNMEESIEGYERALARNIQIERSFPEERIIIAAVPSELKQIWRHLILNAYQALEGKGRIWIKVREEGGWAHITFANDGPPISTTVMQNIFQPLFTTKAVGQSSGLGLYICKQVIAGLQGEISVHSTAEATAFHITLPKP
jgi:signal transduction histidine kinase